MSSKSDIKKHKIKANKIQCQICREIIESAHVHDFRMCKCGRCDVDGGSEYLRRIGDQFLYIEMSEYEN